MSRIVKRFEPRSTFGRAVGILVGGSGGAQLLVVLASPFLARLFKPEDFGVYAAYVALITIPSIISGMRYELAIPLPSDEDSARALVWLSVGSSLIVTALAVLAVHLLRDRITSWLGVQSLTVIYLWILPTGLLASSFFQICTYWALRAKRYKDIANSRVIQAGLAITVQLSLSSQGALGLVAGHLIGQIVGVLFLCAFLFRRGKIAIPSKDLLSRTAKAYAKFPLYSTWSGLLNVAGNQIPPLLFATLFHPAAAGLYALAQRVLMTPFSIVGSAAGNVFLSQAADAHRLKQTAPLVAQVYRQLAQIAIPPTIILALAGPQLFTVVFGNDWSVAGRIAQWMTPWLYMVFVASPLSTIFEIADKQRTALLFQLILLTARLGSVAIGVMHNDLLLAVALFSIASALCWGALLLGVFHTSGVPLVQTLSLARSPAIWAIVCATPLAASVFYSEKLAIFLLCLAFTAGALVVRGIHVLRSTNK